NRCDAEGAVHHLSPEVDGQRARSIGIWRSDGESGVIVAAAEDRPDVLGMINKRIAVVLVVSWIQGLAVNVLISAALEVVNRIGVMPLQQRRQIAHRVF